MPCRVTDAGLVSLSGLTGLRELSLLGCTNEFMGGDAGIEHMTGMTGMTSLRLSDDPGQLASDAALRVIGGSMRQLRELEITGAFFALDELLPLA